MRHSKPLPDSLVERYRRWHAKEFARNRERYAELATIGQSPSAMIITCCDSRVLANEIFSAAAGDFFIHRNIANLVPPHQPDAQYHGTSATIEYAVRVLKVAHLIVMGHWGCGGVKGCHDLLTGAAPDLAAPDSFIGNWVRILEPGFRAVAHLPPSERVAALEKQAILVSLSNLMTFPFVREAVESGRLSTHGVWKDIRDGGLEVYDASEDRFLRL
jgi:carbonic anhydrase